MKRLRRVRLYRAVVHLKGGGSFPIVAEEIDLKSRDNDLTEMTWKRWRGDSRPLYVCLDDVQAVAVRRHGHRWVWR